MMLKQRLKIMMNIKSFFSKTSIWISLLENVYSMLYWFKISDKYIFNWTAKNVISNLMHDHYFVIALSFQAFEKLCQISFRPKFISKENECLSFQAKFQCCNSMFQCCNFMSCSHFSKMCSQLLVRRLAITIHLFLKDNTSPISLIDIAWIIAHNSIVKGQTNSSIEYT